MANKAAPVNGFNGTVTLSASGLPTGVTASFNPSSIAAGSTSTLTLSAGPSAAAGTATVIVKGVGGSLTHSGTVSLTVPVPPLPFDLVGWVAGRLTDVDTDTVQSLMASLRDDMVVRDA